MVLGNDYIVIDNRDEKISDDKASSDWQRSFVKDASQLAQMGFCLFTIQRLLM